MLLSVMAATAAARQQHGEDRHQRQTAHGLSTRRSRAEVHRSSDARDGTEYNDVMLLRRQRGLDLPRAARQTTGRPRAARRWVTVGRLYATQRSPGSRSVVADGGRSESHRHVRTRRVLEMRSGVASRPRDLFLELDRVAGSRARNTQVWSSRQRWLPSSRRACPHPSSLKRSASRGARWRSAPRPYRTPRRSR
jgi:hypothetical protein